jgi:tellurite resistance protein TerC
VENFLFIIGFLAIVILILVIDLGLFSKKSKNKENNNKSVSLKQAILMSIFVILCGSWILFFLMQFGHFLHNIDSMERLQQVIAKHTPPCQDNSR